MLNRACDNGFEKYGDLEFCILKLPIWLKKYLEIELPIFDENLDDSSLMTKYILEIKNCISILGDELETQNNLTKNFTKTRNNLNKEVQHMISEVRNERERRNSTNQEVKKDEIKKEPDE